MQSCLRGHCQVFSAVVSVGDLDLQQESPRSRGEIGDHNDPVCPRPPHVKVGHDAPSSFTVTPARKLHQDRSNILNGLPRSGWGVVPAPPGPIWAPTTRILHPRVPRGAAEMLSLSVLETQARSTDPCRAKEIPVSNPPVKAKLTAGLFITSANTSLCEPPERKAPRGSNRV